MKAKEIITEIERLAARDYSGGKDYLGNVPKNVNWKPLPGGSGLMWCAEMLRQGDMNICIIDPVPTAGDPNIEPFQKPPKMTWWSRSEYADRVKAEKASWEDRKNGKVEMIGRLTLTRYNGPIKNAWEVHTITVDEDRRGIGLAKALYGLVLYTMKATLVSGDSQTPGGRRNWVSLASIPGVEVKGLLTIDDAEFGQKKTPPKNLPVYTRREQDREQNNAQMKIDMLMELGFQYIGKQKNRWDGLVHCFAFDVTSGEGELAPAIKNNLSKIYDRYSTLLYARWIGQA
jgi:hypothetical protein